MKVIAWQKLRLFHKPFQEDDDGKTGFEPIPEEKKKLAGHKTSKTDKLSNFDWRKYVNLTTPCRKREMPGKCKIRRKCFPGSWAPHRRTFCIECWQKLLNTSGKGIQANTISIIVAEKDLNTFQVVRHSLRLRSHAFTLSDVFLFLFDHLHLLIYTTRLLLPFSRTFSSPCCRWFRAGAATFSELISWVTLFGLPTSSCLTSKGFSRGFGLSFSRV